MDIVDLFETYLHSPRLLEELRIDFDFQTVEDLYDWLKDFPEAAEVVLMDYFENYDELLLHCEEILASV